jgi:hypothetical protein
MVGRIEICEDGKMITNEDILWELKIDLAVKKFQNYRNKWIQYIQQMDRDNCEILTMWETKSMTPQKTS